MKKLIYESDNYRELIIMRGLPGSGKSTYAKNLKGLVLSTDDYLMKEGVYIYDKSLIPLAHEWNRFRAADAMSSNISRVIIDNTNIKAWEFKPYVILGLRNDYNIYLAEPVNGHKWDAEFLAKNNSHNVPLDIINIMKNNYEPIYYLDEILFSKRPF
ncbi:MAG: ATP-binding protein [Candidatus Nanoarchaeia archaeon]|nr:ATP-binding protein [Candidatus Nanoarchaeia archaeon]